MSLIKSFYCEMEVCNSRMLAELRPPTGLWTKTEHHAPALAGMRDRGERENAAKITIWKMSLTRKVQRVEESPRTKRAVYYKRESVCC